MKTLIKGQMLSGERSLFLGKDLRIENCTFNMGESPLKESSNIELYRATFDWKYPLWYAKHIHADHCTWHVMARAGVWYSEDLTVEDSRIIAPKNFRKCKNITLKNVEFPNAQETLWWNDGVVLDHVSAKGDYFCMGSENMVIRDLNLEGNYPFDGAKNVEVHDSYLMSKDAFWNSENVTIYNSYINGEYLCWNSKNVTLIGCTIDSLQGLCYIENLVLKDCKLAGTTLAFEYADVDAEITDHIDSVLNPNRGRIKAPRIGELILEPERVDVNATTFDVQHIEKRYDHNIYEGMLLEDATSGTTPVPSDGAAPMPQFWKIPNGPKKDN